MSMTSEQINNLRKQNVQDRSGQKIGTVGQVWADDSGQPAWFSVKTGLFGRREAMVPLRTASLDQNRLSVPYDKDMVRNAPHVEASADEPLSPDEVTQLYAYYHIEQAPGPREQAGGGPQRRPGAQGEMTLSEERLHVGKERQPAGTARLRKYVVSENVHATMPVEHDEVRLEREPISADARGGTRPDIGEAEREINLTAEQPVVSKEQVPVERVRLSEDEVTEERAVDEPVRREMVDVDMPDRRR